MRKSGALVRAVVQASACVPLLWLALAAPAAEAPKPLDQLITSNCVECHNTTDWAGSLAFDTLELGHTAQDPAIWEKTVTKLRGRLMPPAGAKQPAQADIDALVAYLETSLDGGAKAQHVGHVPI